MNVLITSKYDILTLEEGKSGKPHELEYRGAGLNVFMTGSYKPAQFSAAMNLINNFCEERHIPLHSIRRVKKPRPSRGIKTDTVSMF